MNTFGLALVTALILSGGSYIALMLAITFFAYVLISKESENQNG
jgi:hypothetical protein